MRTVLYGVVVAVALLAGCNNGSGGEYVGKWVNLKTDKRTLEIDRNGENFIIRYT